MRSQHPRAMQGGDIEGEAQREIEKAARRVVRLLRDQTRAFGSPVEHRSQELASLLVQVFIDEVGDDPAAFIEGTLTQIGWQLVVRSGDQAQAAIEHAIDCFSNGVALGLREPIVAPAEGRA